MYEKLLVTLINEWMERVPPKDLIERSTGFQVEELFGKPIKILGIVGLRRVGKTYFVFQLMKLLKKRGISYVYINFEDERIPEDPRVLSDFMVVLRSRYDNISNVALFLDEVHRIPGWSRWLRRIYDMEKPPIIVTGSTSKMTEFSIPYELGGRTLTLRVFPLRFEEFLRFKKIKIDYESIPYSETERSKLIKLLDEYMTFGGLPEVVLISKPRKILLLQEYFNTIILRDILLEKDDVRSLSKTITILKLLANTTYYSASKLANTLKSLGLKTSKDTIIEYQNLAQQAFFIETIPNLTDSLKKQITNPQKTYLADNGFITALSRKKAHQGRLLENAVYIELQRRYFGDPTIEINYWKNREGEVDFVVRSGFEIIELIQVSWDPTEPETKQREIKPLIHLMKKTRIKTATIVTGGHKETLKVGSRTIRFVPYWEWEKEKEKSPNTI